MWGTLGALACKTFTAHRNRKKALLTVKNYFNYCTMLPSWWGWVMYSYVWRMYLIFPEDQLPSGFPTIDMGPQLKVVERSRTATMLCAASGNPDPEITWFKDFLPVNTSNNNGRIKQLRSGNQCFSILSPSVLTFIFPEGFFSILLPELLFLLPWFMPFLYRCSAPAMWTGCVSQLPLSAAVVWVSVTNSSRP